MTFRLLKKKQYYTASLGLRRHIDRSFFMSDNIVWSMYTVKKISINWIHRPLRCRYRRTFVRWFDRIDTIEISILIRNWTNVNFFELELPFFPEPFELESEYIIRTIFEPTNFFELYKTKTFEKWTIVNGNTIIN